MRDVGRADTCFCKRYSGSHEPSIRRAIDVGRGVARASAPEAIVSVTSPAVIALQQASRSVPIVFVGVVDPVGSGLVASMSRPGGNATGFVIFEYSLARKWLELLKEIAPEVKRAARGGRPPPVTRWAQGNLRSTAIRAAATLRWSAYRGTSAFAKSRVDAVQWL